MKGIALVAVMCVAVGLLTGCATPYPVGTLYTELSLPVTATANDGASPKMGTAECTSILSLVATGDASIEAAKKQGGITEVHHVDWYAENILGIIGKYKVVVYGK